MGQISLSIPTVGLPNSTENPKVGNDLTAIQTVINGNLDATNVSATLAQSATVNQSGQTVKGATNIATSEARRNAAYGTLTTPDQVSGIVLPTNGLIRVWYWATWQESVAAAARAAIFIGANQLKTTFGVTPSTQAGATGSSGPVATNVPLFSLPVGLASGGTASTYPGDVTTGQTIAANIAGTSGVFGEFGGTVEKIGGADVADSLFLTVGGPCDVFAAAGTYTVSVQFKASSGTVTASNRKLWVQALSFS